MRIRLLILMLVLGLLSQAFGQTPVRGLEGSWHGTLDAAGTKLRLVLTVTKSEAGTYTGKLDSLDQGATLPVDTITLNGDAVRVEIKAVEVVYEAVLNKERTELTGTFTQGGQPFPLTFRRSETAAATPTPTPTPSLSPTIRHRLTHPTLLRTSW